MATTNNSAGGRPVSCSDMNIICDPKFSKPFPPDPHHIPGYTGHCPQLKFHFAKSYGKLTGELLKETRSDRLQVLSADSNTSHPSIGGKDLNRIIPPGYMGFIPRRNKYFGFTFSEVCRKALMEFNQEEEERIRRRSMALPLIVSQPIDRPKPPLRAISSTLPSYKSLNPFIPPGKPYQLEDEHPQKYFISGFAGHVPKSRFLFGKGYPVITNEALIEYGKQQRAQKTKGEEQKGKAPSGKVFIDRC